MELALLNLLSFLWAKQPHLYAPALGGIVLDADHLRITELLQHHGQMFLDTDGLPCRGVDFDGNGQHGTRSNSAMRWLAMSQYPASISNPT